MNNQNPLPHLLRYFRKKNGYTQDQMAELLSIARASYANYELGRSTPDIQQIVKLSQILDHDFLFAYALSAQSGALQKDRIPAGVYEDSPYQALQIATDITHKLSDAVKQLTLPDLELLQTYAELRIKQEKEDEEKTNPSNKEVSP